MLITLGIHVLLGTGMQFDFVDGNWIRVKPLNEGSAGVMGNPAFAAVSKSELKSSGFDLTT